MSSNERSKLNHRTNLTYWQQLVYDCRNSGMTVKAWCAEHGISEKSYYYRQRKVWEAAAQAEQESREVATQQPTVPAIIPCSPPIALEQQEPESFVSTPVMVLRNSTWTVDVNADCNPELLRLALRAVK